MPNVTVCSYCLMSHQSFLQCSETYDWMTGSAQTCRKTCSNIPTWVLLSEMGPSWSGSKEKRPDKQKLKVVMAVVYLTICDWLTELRFYIPLDAESVISETFFPANLLAWYWKKTKTVYLWKCVIRAGKKQHSASDNSCHVGKTYF